MSGLFNNHRKFFKRKDDKFQIGDYIGNLVLGKSKIKVEDEVSKYNHLVLVLLSTSCSPCQGALEVIDRFTEENKELRIIIMIETQQESFEELRAHFNDRVLMLRVDVKTLETLFGNARVPFGYGINNEGIILSKYSFTDNKWFAEVINPIKELVRI